LQDGKGRHRFAAARFAHHTQGTVAFDGHIYTIYGLHHPFGGKEVSFQPLNLN
jgi:hypothetical protein